MNGRFTVKRIVQGLGLLLCVLLISPFLFVSLCHYLFKKRKHTSLYVRAVYRVPWLYEFHNRIFTFPVWEHNFRHLPSLPGRTLHLGCGTGFGAGIIEQKALETVHMDISERFVQYGAKRKKLKYAVIADAYRLPFKDKSFDRIVIPVAFHHLLDHASLFTELKRVMQAQGLMLIFDPVSIRPRKNRIANTFHDGRIWIFDHKGILKTTASILEKNGLEVRRVTYFRSVSLQNYNLVYPMRDVILELGEKAQCV